ncbi:MAG: LysM peptidoglycan-binding domain-containing protein [Candidatus Methylacidiphilales bacterium]
MFCPGFRILCSCFIGVVVSGGLFSSHCAIAMTRDQVERSVQAKAFLLVDAANNKVLFSRRADVPYPPASTVKLMTALLVWEHNRLNGTIKVDVSDTRVEPSHVPLRAGEVVSVRDMTKALLVGSDNDSAMVLGRKVAGSHSAFLELMNRRAHELGCRHTVFKTPNGLPAAGQVTTCHDMLRIFQKVLEVPELKEFCSLRGFTLKTAVGSQWVKNHNRLLGTFEGMGAAKTGWTYASRHTYAASAQRSGRELHLIILNSPNKWTDARLLFEYGFLTTHRKEAVAITKPQVSPPEPVSSGRTHRVRQGETLYMISLRYGVSMESLIRMNRISNPNVIRAGIVLQIPES